MSPSEPRESESGRRERELLRSIVETARAIFGSRAASVFLLDEEADELVFEAVSGEGEDDLVGMRFPSSTGIAGWVLVTRQPLVVDDLSNDPRFARRAADSTGYVPDAIVAVPLVTDDRTIGVLELLDRPTDRSFSLDDMSLLTLFAHQAAIGLDLLLTSRRSAAAVGGSGADAIAARLAALLDRDDDGTARALLEALEGLLGRR